MEDRSSGTEVKEAMAKTRKSTDIFGLGPGINDNDANITGSKLPNEMQVLRCMLFHIKNGSSENRTQNEAAKIVLQQIETFYAKANIPLVSEWYACQRLVKLVNDNKKLRDIPVKRRSTPYVQSLVEKTKKDLEKTFRLWPENAEELIKNEQDRKFLQSMKSDRVATFGCFEE